MLVPDHQVRFTNRTPTHPVPRDKFGTDLANGHGHKKMPRQEVEQVSYVVAENIEERTLRDNIAALCADEKQKRQTLVEKSSELSPIRSDHKATRAALAMNLSQMKELLAGTGRDGQWLPFLKQNGLPRTTADRLVNKHRAMENSSPNGYAGDIKEPSRAEVQTIAKSVVSRCRCLVTDRLVDMFILELQALLRAQALEHTSSAFIPSPPPIAPPAEIWEENEL